MGRFEMILPFIVLPKDGVLARRANFRKEVSPNEWFTQFPVFPVDSVVFNDPNISTNWIKSSDAKGKPVYTFNIAK